METTRSRSKRRRTWYLTDVDARCTKAQGDLTPLQAALDAKDVEADCMLGRVSEEIGNEVGRPASDPALSIFLPVAQAKAHAKQVRAMAKTLRAAVEQAQPALARVALLERVRRALSAGFRR